MASLIAVLFFAILFNQDVYCITGSEFAASSVEVDSTSISNSSDPQLEGHQVIHGPKTRTHTLIESLPEESNRTDLPVARNDSFEEANTTEDGQILLWRNTTNSQHDQSTPLAESSDYEDDNSTESRFDPSGCDTLLRNKHEDYCHDNFENSIEESRHIEDEAEKGKLICCASEEYERCCITGYKEANCVADRDSIKKNLKAARMFMATLSDISCAIHRGKCDFHSAATRFPLSPFLLVTLGFLPIAFLL